MRTVYYVSPTFNEADNVGTLIDRFFTAVDTIDIAEVHLLIADGSSPDGTGQVVKDLQDRYPRLHLLEMEKGGLGKDYARAFKHVLENTEAVMIGQMDADLSHDPKEIIEMIKAADEGADAVIGSRFISGAFLPGDWAFLRVLNTKVANGVAKHVGGVLGVKDRTTGYRLHTRELLEGIQYESETSTGYVFQMNNVNEFQKNDFKIVEVPISFSDRQFGESKIRLKDVRQFIECAFRLENNSPNKRFQALLRQTTIASIGGIAAAMAFIYGLDWALIPSAMMAMVITAIVAFALIWTRVLSQPKVHSDGAYRNFENRYADGSYISKLLLFVASQLPYVLVGVGCIWLLDTVDAPAWVAYPLASILSLKVAIIVPAINGWRRHVSA